MKANQILVEALEQAAAELESEADRLNYDWENLAACNCGVLAQKIMRFDQEGLSATLAEDKDFTEWSWSHSASAAYLNIRPSTGLPSSKVFAALCEVGLEKEDFESIEFLNYQDEYKDPVASFKVF